MVKKSPLFYYSLFYISGIYIGNNISCQTELFFYLSLTTLVISLYLFYLTYSTKSFKLDIYLKSFIFLTFFFSGIFNMGSSPYAKKNLVSTLLRNKQIEELKLTVKTSPKIGQNSSSIECHAIDYNENIILYSKKKIDSINLGDIITINYSPIEISNRDKNFNYKEYQAKRRCFTYGFLNKSDLKRVQAKGKSIIFIIRLKRDRLIQRVRYIYDGSEWCDILIALVSGEKSYLEDKTKEIYKASGAIHLMAVSGLHIGFIYYFTLNILAFMGKGRVMKYLKALLLILSIWFYCAFSGFSPSSIRASIMISILTISELFSGRYISLNALCASALIIIVVQPQSLFNIGFQLSYVALLSIIVINPFFRVTISNNRVIQYCWNIITISISCQIGTSLITINNFGYFPLYFMVSNLILMPLTAVVLYSFSAITLLGFSGVAVNFLTQIIKTTIDVMYKTALKIESLPFSIIYIKKSITTEILAYSIVVSLISIILYSSRKKSLQSRSNE